MVIRHVKLNAPEEIRHLIVGFWYLEQDFGPIPSDFEVLPDGHAEIVFHYGSGCSLVRDGEPRSLPSPFIVGLLGHTVNFYVKDRLRMVGIKCHPWGIYELLELTPIKDDVSEFAHPIADLQDMIKPLLDVDAIEQALQQVCNWVIDRAASLVAKDLLLRAGNAMLNAEGNLRVRSVAESAHATVRTLERSFKAAAGHTVKDVSRLMRFEQVRNSLWRQPDLALTVLAHQFGYADHSHLNREFKHYCGMTAGAFARQTKTRKESFADDFVAIVLSSK